MIAGPPSAKILVVDDEPDLQALILQKFRRPIREKRLAFLFARDGQEALECLAENRDVDVVVSDINMPRMDGLAATAAVTALPDPPRVVVLTTFDLDEHVFGALRAGASGFLLKDTPPRELVAAVRVVASGEAMLSPTATRRLIGHYADTAAAPRRERARARLDDLTPREREVLVAVGRGLSNAEVGRELFLSEATVKAHVSRVLTKLGATNRVQVAIRVLGA